MSARAERPAPDAASARHERDRREARRSRRRARLLPAEFNIAPMIDVVFLLLIYFLLVGEFRKNEEVLRLELPRPAVAGAPADPFALPQRPIRVAVRSHGDAPAAYTLSLDPPDLGAAPTFADLRAALSRARDGALPADQLFIIEPARDTRWEHTLGVLSAIERAGFTRINLSEAEE